MKLQHLPIGARFEFEGQVLVKTGPLTAASEQGGQRIIPRYATLKPLDAPPDGVQAASGKLDETKVLAAFSAFHETCSGLVDESSRPELAAARLRFLAALK